jgi:hypothetical protein
MIRSTLAVAAVIVMTGTADAQVIRGGFMPQSGVVVTNSPVLLPTAYNSPFVASGPVPGGSVYVPNPGWYAPRTGFTMYQPQNITNGYRLEVPTFYGPSYGYSSWNNGFNTNLNAFGYTAGGRGRGWRR